VAGKAVQRPPALQAMYLKTNQFHRGYPDTTVELERLNSTNHDGRTDTPLIADRPLPIGTYELRFSTAGYFTARGVALSDPPYLDVVPIRFSIAEPEGHYHVPLVMTPWSYSTYRGS